eukprot:scaffold99167_cov23-Tisochrysis_lutea.AAC.2
MLQHHHKNNLTHRHTHIFGSVHSTHQCLQQVDWAVHHLPLITTLHAAQQHERIRSGPCQHQGAPSRGGDVAHWVGGTPPGDLHGLMDDACANTAQVIGQAEPWQFK